ncbi:TPA: restriction endonuclease subunit S [Vibrio cholerae]
MENLALMPKYEAYKDSQVQWIGDIPANWYLEKAKWLFYKADRKPLVDDDIVTCFRDGQVTLRKNRRTEGFTNALKEHGYQRICKGDLVIHAMDAFAGAIGVSDSDGKSTPVYAACVPRKKGEVNSYYYAYYMRDLALSGFIVSLAKGIRERSTDFRFNDFAELLLPFPDYEEQIRIANFLDKKTEQIDEAIAIKEKQISLLKERKQIIIQQAVTQGLDPNVPMKDTGVDWIGKIPAHWEVLPLTKYSTRVDYRGKTPEKVELGRFLLTAKNIKNGYIDYDASKEYIREEQYEKVMSRGKPRIGDLLFTTEAPLGSTALVDDTSVAIAQRLILFRLSRRFVSGYVNLYMQTTMFQKLLQKLGTGSTALGIKASKFCFLKLVTPPEKEQLSIFQFSEKVSYETNSAIAVLQQQIDKLKEYKTTLINSAVTGKIKITPEMVEQ